MSILWGTEHLTGAHQVVHTLQEAHMHGARGFQDLCCCGLKLLMPRGVHANEFKLIYVV